MKPTKLKSTIYLVLASAIVAVWIGFLIFGLAAVFFSGTASTVSDEKKFDSQEIGLKFSYPSLYALTERQDSYKSTPIHVLTLINASTTIPDMSEGPTAISAIEIPVSGTTTLEQWVQGASISNFYLSPDKTFLPTKVDGEPALAYRYSGLYESDAVAVQHGGKIYLFAASWIDANDRIRSDFKNLLSSVTFTK